MKKKLVLMAVVGLLTICSCSKEKSCRCSVRHSQKVRIVNVKSWQNCADIRYLEYNVSQAEIGVVDSLLCIDFVFDADSVFNK